MCYLASYVSTLLVWVERDSVILVFYAHAMCDHLLGSHFVVFLGGGHELHRRHVEQFADVLADFVF